MMDAVYMERKDGSVIMDPIYVRLRCARYSFYHKNKKENMLSACLWTCWETPFPIPLHYVFIAQRQLQQTYPSPGLEIEAHFIFFIFVEMRMHKRNDFANYWLILFLFANIGFQPF